MLAQPNYVRCLPACLGQDTELTVTSKVFFSSSWATFSGPVGAFLDVQAKAGAAGGNVGCLPYILCLDWKKVLLSECATFG